MRDGRRVRARACPPLQLEGQVMRARPDPIRSSDTAELLHNARSNIEQLQVLVGAVDKRCIGLQGKAGMGYQAPSVSTALYSSANYGSGWAPRRRWRAGTG